MTKPSWNRLRDVFEKARNLAPAERAAFLDEHLADDASLRREVEALLRAEEKAARFLAPSVSSADVDIPETLGPYTIRERLGEGGFGVVHRAEQSHPLRREVAIKFIKPGMDTKEVIARFDSERQALAIMDHPAIARVFDAGQTEAGRPYFAMELVDGVPITRYCDDDRMLIRDRIELFLVVCDAVQHAHQKGVIHRDLKPTNVLVTRRDGKPTPKIIDFGISKAMSVGLDEHTFATRKHTFATRHGTVLGTLGSMSPEQAGAIASPIDTRSDIYSLGVLLYELLVGSPPFDAKRLRSMSWTDAIRVIREEDPPPLAARLAAESGPETLARLRGTDRRALSRELRGDLEWITGRTLEKEPERRYPSVSEFAADLRRHLANETVLAGAPSRMHRLRKYVRRHRVGVVAAIVVFTAILTGGIVAAVGFGRAVRAEREARHEAAVARRVSDFLESLFLAAQPGRLQSEPVTAESLLDEGAKLITTRLGDDAEVRSRLMTVMGRSYLRLGHSSDGLALLEEAVAVAESASTNPEFVARQLAAFANAKLSAGETNEVGELLDRAEALADAHGKTNEAWRAALAYDRASLFWNRGELTLADSTIARAISVAQASNETNSSTLARYDLLHGQIALHLFDLDRAEEAFLRALELNHGEGRDPDIDFSSHGLLSSVYSAKQDAVRAIRYAENAIQLADSNYPRDHFVRGSALEVLADAVKLNGDFRRAIELQKEAVRITGLYPARVRILVNQLFNLAFTYDALGDRDQAIATAEKAVAVSREAHGEGSFDVGRALESLGMIAQNAGRWAVAESSYVRAIEILERKDKKHPQYASALMNYATILSGRRSFARADSFYARAEALFDSSTAGSREWHGLCLTNRGYSNARRGNYEESERLFQRGMAMRRGDLEETSQSLRFGYLEWAAARALAGDTAGALEKLRLAAASGATLAHAEEYPEVLAMRGEAEFPLRSAN